MGILQSLLLALLFALFITLRRYLVQRRSGPPAGRAYPFGYKSSWLAIKDLPPEQVIRDLGISGAAPSGWREGLSKSYHRKGVFVTPPLDGWVLVVGAGPLDPDALARLSARLGTEVQAFSTDRATEAHAWAKASRGDLGRAFSCLEFITQEDRGERTGAEAGIDFITEWPSDDQVLRFPQEEDVLRVAGAWSVDPSRLGERGEVGPGWCGRLEGALG